MAASAGTERRSPKASAAIGGRVGAVAERSTPPPPSSPPRRRRSRRRRAWFGNERLYARTALTPSPTFERGVSAASFTLGFVGSSLVAFLCAPRPSRRSFPLNNRKFCPNFKSPKTLFWRTVPLGQRVGRRVHSRAALGGHQRRRAERTRSLCACDSCASSSPSWPRSTVTPPRASAVTAALIRVSPGPSPDPNPVPVRETRNGRWWRGALFWPRSGGGARWAAAARSAALAA